jgi:hypothetical protein
VTGTPAGRSVLGQLSDLNDGLCFAMFAEHETQRELDRFSAELDGAYSTELFSDNPYAPRVHVKLRILRDFQRSHRGTSLMAYVSAAYEAMRCYCDSLPEKAVQWGVQVSLTASGNTPEQTFRNRMLPGVSVSDEILHTLEWIRWRRNHWIHRATLLDPKWATLAANHGGSLNQHWGRGISAVDFTITDLLPLKPDAAVEVIKLLRICADEIDTHVRRSMSKQGMLEFCARMVPEGFTRTVHADVIAERARKTRGIARAEFACRVDLSEAKAAVLSVMR